MALAPDPELVAQAFSVGGWDASQMVKRAALALEYRRTPKWLPPLAHRVVSAFPHGGSVGAIARFLAALDPVRFDDAPRGVRSEGRALRWPVAPLADVRAVAEHLGLSMPTLRWMADVRALERTVTDEALRHYRYRWVAKSSGGARLIESPKPTLRHAQRTILRTVLDAIPAHDAAHGFRRGRSVRTFVAPHIGAPVLVGLDLEAFFSSISAGRVFGLFETAGYASEVAHVLTGLVTNAVPPSVSDDPRHRQPHLPQGAPTSPALANLVAWSLDCRLAGLAARFDARYTRYADDLAFSGGRSLARSAPALVRCATSIVRQEGLRINDAKTRVAGPGARHRLGGVVVNERAGIDRREIDGLRALLHDAARNGVAAANRRGVPDLRAHVLGRISWVASIDPRRGEQLRQQFERVDW
jgi:RNA-directed DNA polymerase